MSKPENLFEPTIEEFQDVFANWLQTPSYLRIAQQTLPLPGQEVEVRYHAAVESVRDQIYTTEGTSEDHQVDVDRAFLLNTFTSSEGSESRLTVYGYKPVARISGFYSHSVKQDAKYSSENVIPIHLTTPAAVAIHTEVYPEIGYTVGYYGRQNTALKHTGFLYNSSAVGNLMDHNAELFSLLDCSTDCTPSEFVENAVAVPHPITENILLGYAPITTLVHLLTAPADLQDAEWMTFTSDQGRVSETDIFWNALPKILDERQYDMALRIARKPKIAEQLGVFATSARSEDFVYRTTSNQGAQAAWNTSGLDAYLTNMRQQMHASEGTHRKL